MSTLIQELKQDHVAVLAMLDKLKGAKVGTDETQRVLSSIKTALHLHLKKEDSSLYPALRKAAEKDDGLKQTLDLFARDMDSIARAALDFIDTFYKGGDEMTFARELGKFKVVLRSRIGKEESVLYSKYDRLAA